MSMYGISDKWADVIIAKRNKREFEDIEDVKKETGIPERVLKKFKFKNDWFGSTKSW
jgi:DNA uptake protein ComE-like DNA-binding protein